MGFFDKLKAGLTKTKSAVFGQVNEIVKNFRKVDEELLEELQEKGEELKAFLIEANLIDIEEERTARRKIRCPCPKPRSASSWPCRASRRSPAAYGPPVRYPRTAPD